MKLNNYTTEFFSASRLLSILKTENIFLLFLIFGEYNGQINGAMLLLTDPCRRQLNRIYPQIERIFLLNNNMCIWGCMAQ